MALIDAVLYLLRVRIEQLQRERYWSRDPIRQRQYAREMERVGDLLEEVAKIKESQDEAA